MVVLNSKSEWPAFGRAFAVDGDVIAAVDEAVTKRTIVRILRVTGGTVVEEAKLDIAATAVSVDRDRVAAVTATDVLLYRASAGRWVRDGEFPAPCGDTVLDTVALRGDVLVLGDESKHVCIYEHQAGEWKRTTRLREKPGILSEGEPAFDGSRLAMPRRESRTVELAAPSPTGWRTLASIQVTGEDMHAESADVDGGLVAVGGLVGATVWDVGGTSPRQVATLQPQKIVENTVARFGSSIALRRPILAAYDAEAGVQLYAEQPDHSWKGGGVIPPVREGVKVSFLDRVAIGTLIWVGETDSNQPSGPLPGGGRIYGYRWE